MTLFASSCNRRVMIGSALGLAAAGLGGSVSPVGAIRGWCRSDPLIAINGDLADIFCTAPLTAPLYVTGPTEIVVTVPRGVRAKLILAGPGFGQGEEVRFDESRKLKETESGIEVNVAVWVPARNEMEIGVEFAPRIIGILNPDRAQGTVNEWIRLGTTF